MSFTEILNVSISASWLVGAIILIRLVLKRAPKAMVCALWALVAVRLLCPVLPESGLSLVPTAQILPEEYLHMEPRDDLGRQATLDIVTNPVYPEAVEIELNTRIGTLQWRDVFWTLIWWAGMGVMVLYALYSYISLRLRTRVAVKLRDRIFLCDDIDSPFILGILRPRICLPSALEPSQMPHVIAHENAHLKRFDHWWKPLGFMLLTVHWFNPVMWLAYILLCRDIELACDERVIRDMDRSAVRAYSEALIACGTRQRFVAACPLAFGEVGVKERVKSMVNYKRPGFWIILIAVVLTVVVAVCFLTNPEATTIGNLNEPQFEGFFDDAESIWFFRGDQIGVTDRAEEAADRLKAIELDPNPVSMSVSEDRDSTFQIRVNGRDGLSLRISEDCSQIWADGIKPSYSYAVKAPEELRGILAEYLPGVDMNTLPFVGTYVPHECLYMNPLSSWYAFGGDSGAVYEFDGNSFTIDSRNGSATVYDPVNWDWKPVDWKEEPFSRMVGNLEQLLSGCSELAALLSPEAQYVALGSDMEIILIYDQGQLLLVHTMELNKIGWSIWSIYSLIPEHEMGKAEWEFQPVSSSQYPAFRFEFDMEYTSISATVFGGTLISFDEPSMAGYPSGSMLELPTGAALYWAPVDEQGNVVREGMVRFTVMNGENAIACGTLYITGTEGKYEAIRNGDETTREIEPAVYTAKLIGTDLRLTHNEDGTGGTIYSTWLPLGTATIEE